MSDDNPVRYALFTIIHISQSFLGQASHTHHLPPVQRREYHNKSSNFLSDRLSSFQQTDLYICAVKAGGEVSSDEITSMLARYGKFMSLVEAGYISYKEKWTLIIRSWNVVL